MCRLWIPIVLLLAITAHLRAQDGPAKAHEKNTDLLGDPLPDGVTTRMGTVRLRHAGAIFVTAWTPDGKLLASAGSGDFIRLWDPATGKEVRQIKGARGIAALLFFNDGKTLVSADLQGNMRIWEIDSGRELRRFGNPKDRVTCLALSPDNRTLYSAGSDRIVRQWLVAGGVELRQFPAQTGNILALAITPDGKELRTAAADSVALIYDTATGLETRRFAIVRAFPGVPAKFSRDGKVLACTRSEGANVNLYDADTGKLLRAFDGVTHHFYDDRGNHTSSVSGMSMRPYALDFSPNGKFLAAALSDAGVRVYGLASGQELRVFENPPYPRGAMAFAPDGKTLAVTAGDQTLRLWHVADAREISPLPGHVTAVQALCFSRDGTLLFTAAVNDRHIRVWERATGKEIGHFESKIGIVHQLSVGPGPRSVYCIGLDGAFEWTMNDDKQMSKVRKWDQVKSPTRLAASRDGKLLALVGADPAIVLLDATSGEIRTRLGEAKAGVPGKPAFRATSLAFSPDNQLLVVAGFNSPIQVWKVATGRFVRQFGQSRDEAVKFAFSPDSKLLAVGDFDTKLYEVATGQERQHMAQTNGVRALAFSPDGRQLFAGLSKGVQFVEVSTGSPVGQHGDALGVVRTLAISPDGAILASAGLDTTVMLWAKPPWREPTQPAAPLRLEPAELDLLWKTLAQPDGIRAHQAIWALARAHQQSVPFLKDKIPPAPSSQPKQVERYIRDLDSSIFEVRQRALRDLELLGDHAEIALRAALNNNPSLESRRRMEEILTRVNNPTPEKLRILRAFEVLEYADSDTARQMLTALAEGGTGHWLTEYAREAQKRQHRVKRLP